MSTPRGSHVVLGVSDSMAGLEALRVAVAQARARGVPLCAVRTWYLSAGFAGEHTQQWSREIAAEQATILRAAFDEAMGGLPADIPVELIVTAGQPGPVLVGHASHDGDLLVIGTPDRARRWSTGGPAHYCRRHATCPVLVVPPHRMARLGRPVTLARKARREADRMLHAAGSKAG